MRKVVPLRWDRGLGTKDWGLGTGDWELAGKFLPPFLLLQREFSGLFSFSLPENLHFSPEEQEDDDCGF